MNIKSIIFLSSALAAGAVFAGRVTLKSGSFLTGEAGAIVGDTLKFASDDLGEIGIKIENIASIETETLHAVKYADNRIEDDRAITVVDGKLFADGAELDMSEIKEIDPVPETWHGSVNFAYESDRGNTYKNSATIIANLNRRWENNRFNADFGYYYSKNGVSKQSADKTVDRWELAGQHDHFWSEKFYSYVGGNYEQDDIAGIDFRLRLGAGAGYQWLEGRNFESTGIWSFSQEFGASWVRVKYDERDSDAKSSFASLRYAHHLKYQPKWNTDLEGFHNLEYLPQADDWSNYLLDADVGFSTKIIMGFDLIAKIEFDYNSVPSAGRKSSDVRYIVGLGYKW
ncbi:MAG: DUF481 domain-containing protein [Kiritimatiellae bacterium]|nr:DUF481 domain-containing protein [Kiritimatiellia bacterium]